MKARDDIDPSRTWVISDTHFGHKNIVAYCHRPPDVEELMLENIAEAVQPGDTLLHLGDLCYKGNAWFKNIIAPKIAPGARKLLILGNHDKQRSAFYRQTGWHVTAPFYIEADPYIVSFSHYPWSAHDLRGRLPGEFDKMAPNHHRLHGHIHNNGYYDGRPYDLLIPFLWNHTNLSVEQTKYKPVRLDLLLNAVLYGRLPEASGGRSADGDAPSASDLGKESHHA